MGRVQTVSNQPIRQNSSRKDFVNDCSSYKILGCPWWLFVILALVFLFALLAIVGASAGAFSKHKIAIIAETELAGGVP